MRFYLIEMGLCESSKAKVNRTFFFKWCKNSAGQAASVIIMDRQPSTDAARPADFHQQFVFSSRFQQLRSLASHNQQVTFHIRNNATYRPPPTPHSLKLCSSIANNWVDFFTLLQNLHWPWNVCGIEFTWSALSVQCLPCGLPTELPSALCQVARALHPN